MENNDDCEACWICLEGMEGLEATPGPLHANRLIQPCRCPRVVHSVCLAKWQLSQSGKSEEKFCRFCQEQLPDWQENLALPGMAAVEPVMSVHFNGQTHMVKVKPGEEGREAFIQDVRRLLRLRDNQEFSITFECKVPGHGMFLDLKGLSSYDAAVFCAAMTAVERQRLAAQKAQKAAILANGGAALSACLVPAVPGGEVAAAAAAATASGSDSGTSPAAAAAADAPTASEEPSRPSTSGSDSAASDADIHQSSSRLPSSSSDSSMAAAVRHRPSAAEVGEPAPTSTSTSQAAVQALSSAPAAAAAAPAGPRQGQAPSATSEQRRSRAGRRSSGSAQPAQQQGPAAVQSGGWGSNACDSACEVESAGAAGAGNSDAAVEGSSSASTAGGGTDRHKSSWHGRHGQVLGGRPAPLAAERSRQEGTGATWLSRLMLCASFGGHQEASR